MVHHKDLGPIQRSVAYLEATAGILGGTKTLEIIGNKKINNLKIEALRIFKKVASQK
ncbi:hypothetical protein BH10PAT1_BH10PAT1_0440 [soil metagenome]